MGKFLFLLLIFIANFAFGAQNPQFPCPKLYKYIEPLEGRINRRYSNLLNLKDIFALKAGDKIFIAPEFMEKGSTLKSNIPMNIVKIEISNKTKFIYLQDPNTRQTIKIPILRLYGKTYSGKDIVNYLPYTEGEYVEIGDEDRLDIAWSVPKYQSVGSVTYEQPRIGTFIRALDDDSYLIALQFKFEHDKMVIQYEEEVVAPKSMVRGLTGGTEHAVLSNLHELLSLRLHFSKGERIRFRNENGLMENGRIIRSRRDEYEIEDLRGIRIAVPKKSVFKQEKDLNAKTPIYKADILKAKFENPSGVLAKFLDGGAILSSQAKYLALTPKDKILTLLKYTQRHLPWTSSARQIENAGLGNFEKIVCAGAGVCRHNSILLAVLLSEAGYKTRLVTYFYPDGGHAWLEVELKNKSGIVETYIVDPSDPKGYVHTMGETKKIAESIPDSFARKYYTVPERKYLEAP